MTCWLHVDPRELARTTLSKMKGQRMTHFDKQSAPESIRARWVSWSKAENAGATPHVLLSRLDALGISAFGFIQLKMQTNQVISRNYSVITCNYTMSCGIELIASPKGFVEESVPCAPQPPGLKASWTAAPFKHTLTHYRTMEGFQGPSCLHSSASGTMLNELWLPHLLTSLEW